MNLIIIIIILSFLWVLRTVRSALFNVWIWQLKEYRLDRMRAHLSIPSGRKLIFNWLNIFKLGLLFFLVLTPFVSLWLVMAFFTFESLLGLKEILSKKFYRPKFTPKALLILSLALGIEFLFIIVIQYLAYSLFTFLFYF